MREAEESMDVVSRLRGEEKSYRKHSRDEPELAPKNVVLREEAFENLVKAEQDMVTECHTPKEAPQDEARAESYSSKELDGNPTHAVMQEEYFVNHFANGLDPGTRDILVAHTEHYAPSDALALSLTDSQSKTHDVTQHPNAKEDEAKDVQRAEDLDCLESMEREIETNTDHTRGIIPLGTEDQAVDAYSPEAETALVTPCEESKMQPA